MKTHTLPFELTEQEDYSLRWIADRYVSGEYLYLCFLHQTPVSLLILSVLCEADCGEPDLVPCLGGRVRDWLKEIGF